MNKKHHQEWQNATNVTQFEYFCGNFELYSSINKGATIKPLHNFEEKKSGPGFGQKQLWPWPCVDKYFGFIHLKKNVCPLSMKRKCLPSIHEKKMSALYAWCYHGSRTDLILVSWCSGLYEEMSVAKFELHSVTEH